MKLDAREIYAQRKRDSNNSHQVDKYAKAQAQNACVHLATCGHLATSHTNKGYATTQLAREKEGRQRNAAGIILVTFSRVDEAVAAAAAPQMFANKHCRARRTNALYH